VLVGVIPLFGGVRVLQGDDAHQHLAGQGEFLKEFAPAQRVCGPQFGGQLLGEVAWCGIHHFASG
jgi:hypothetical protein